MVYIYIIKQIILYGIFIIFFVAYLITSLVGFAFGKPKRILYPYDEDGHACGYDEGYEDYKMLYFYNVIENLEKLKISKIVNAFCVNECPTKFYDKKEYKNKKIILDCIPTENNPDCNVTYKNYYRSKELLKRFCFPSDTEELEFDPNTQEKILVYDYTKKINIERVVESGDGMGGTVVDVQTDIPKDAMAEFDIALKDFVGSTVKPFALLATQVVKGVDYIFAAEVTPVTKGGELNKKVALVTVNSMTPGANFVDILASKQQLVGYAFTWLGAPLGEWP
jgi:hypothetical protein